MIEVEVKARAPPNLKDRILSLGAVPGEVENHTDVYFSGVRDFARTDEALRIRLKESGAYLTYKGPKLDSKTKSRMEITVAVDDPAAMEELLGHLGYRRATVVRKRREKYRLKDTTFALDEVQGLGSFVEVETTGKGDWSSEREKVLQILESLGVSESITKSYLELLLENGSGVD